MTDWAEPTAWPPPPRTVPWAALRDRGLWFAIAGAVLCAAGVLWLAVDGANPHAIAGAPDAGTDTTGVRAVGWLLLPGVFCLAVWLRTLWRWHTLLARGRVVPAKVEFQQRVLFPPGVVYVGYRFRADQTEGQHRCRIATRTPEGACLWRGGRDLFAVYDPERPSFHVLAAAARLRGVHEA